MDGKRSSQQLRRELPSRHPCIGGSHASQHQNVRLHGRTISIAVFDRLATHLGRYGCLLACLVRVMHRIVFLLLTGIIAYGQGLFVGAMVGERPTDDVTSPATPESKRYVVGPIIEFSLSTLFERNRIPLDIGTFAGNYRAKPLDLRIIWAVRAADPSQQRLPESSGCRSDATESNRSGTRAVRSPKVARDFEIAAARVTRY